MDVDRENENPDPVCEAEDRTDHLNSLDRERMAEPLCEREQELLAAPRPPLAALLAQATHPHI